MSAPAVGRPRSPQRRRVQMDEVTAALVILLLAVASPASAQPLSNPHAGYVYPAGGREGSTIHATLGGQFLDGASGVLVSGNGVAAKVVDHDKPLNGRQLSDARQRLQELQKNARDPAAQKEIAVLRERVGDSLRRLANLPMSERVTLEIAIAGDAAPGARWLRLVTPIGLTNPLVFCVGELPELREKDVKNEKADSELTIVLPATLNGRIVPGDIDRIPLRQLAQYMPGDIDRYRFAARKGQDLVVEVSARGLMPYLADAVPGWFQATVALRDANGREVAYEDDYRFNPDPVLHYRVPADGDYVIEIKDALYRGREDFVYRIAAGELPFVTSVFPLGGRAGSRTKVALEGWNLPSSQMTMDAKPDGPGIYPLTVRAHTTGSNTLPFAVDDLPATSEREPNDSPKRAQALPLPIIVDGRIQQAGDSDVFRLTGRAGDRIVAEVVARRLESPLDSVLELTDAAGSRLALDDDHEDKGAGWLTHHADSLLAATLPAGGVYFLRIRDAQHKGGVEYGYRLRVSAPRPDFDLRVAPSGINVAGAGTIPITVYALRKDGFAGEIALALKGAPDGFVLSGGTIPGGQDQVRVTLTAPPMNVRAGTIRPPGSGVVSDPPILLRVEGRATISGRTVEREAIGADDMMQAFAYHHLVSADSLRVSVTSRGATRVGSKVLVPTPVRIPAGGAVRVRVSVPLAYYSLDKVRFDLSDPPDGITLRSDPIDQAGATFVLEADNTRTKPGLRGNLIVTVSGERVPAGTAQVRRRVPLGTLPAIPFEITESR